MDATGLILDIYDDTEGTILKQAMPDGQFPDFIKEAKMHTLDELSNFPNEVFALRAVNDGHLIRKYAMTDKGNTAMSVIYFLNTKDHLPGEAIKVAAANLIEGCYFYDIDPPQGLLDSSGGITVDDAGIVDVTGKDPILKVATQATLDTPENVNTACVYFDENYGNMHPKDRHDTAIELKKLASQHEVTISDRIDRYGSSGYAPNLEMGLTIREKHLDQDDVDNRETLHEIYKLASYATPETFVEALAAFDKGMGWEEHWDGGLPDPWLSTFGHVKFAAYKYVHGADTVTAADLQALAQKPILLSESFDKDLVDGFKKEPVQIFDSLPVPQKLIIMRIARDDFTGGRNARTSE